MAYLLDANVFIQAKNLHYGLDFCPAFWEWLTATNEAERLFSIEKVGDEVQAVTAVGKSPGRSPRSPSQ
jgi:hypothetical protein